MVSLPPLTEFEHMVLFVVAALGDDAYGMRVRKRLAQRSGRDAPIATVYAALERLEQRELLSSRLGDPTPERGGRAKRYYRIEPPGVQALAGYRDLLSNFWRDLDRVLDRVTS
ncbi:MAG TPA: helix-turn-helix transcriptional regulator [Acidobacteriota bacterium]|nr:helix-turn-helix transcriptional regulator [Acidobacteriota bacterium]